MAQDFLTSHNFKYMNFFSFWNFPFNMFGRQLAMKLKPKRAKTRQGRRDQGGQTHKEGAVNGFGGWGEGSAQLLFRGNKVPVIQDE
jgi:hypothetical protein